MRRYGVLAAIFLASAGPARASWADGLFEELSRDFGSVPRGSVLSHPFRLVNNTKQLVRISGLRVSCGCVTARAVQSSLAPGQETALIVQMDSRRFSGTKSVTVYVTFDLPRFEEVRIWVQANSRDEVVVTPDGLAFGRIKRGLAPTTAVTVSFLGSSDYAIEEVRCDSNYVQPACKLIRRDDGEVSYQLSATMRHDAPPGKWFTELWLTTNSATMARLRIPLTVEIESALSISPNTVALGQVRAGTETDRKVVIRGVRPFKITGIDGTDNELRIRDSTPESHKVHVLTVTLRPISPGDLARTIRVHTDLKTGGEIEFTAQAKVVSGEW